MEHATPGILILLILFIGPVLYNILGARRKKEIYIRRIPGIDAIDQGIGQSVELGRPLSFTTGLTGISPLLYACLGVLRHVAKKAAIYKCRLYVPSNDPEALALVDATLQSAYRAVNKSSQYDPSTVRYLSDSQFAFAAGYQGLIHRENVGGAFLFGRFAAESLILAEAGQQIGAVQIAATTSPEQVPFFITTCDFTLIGEELFAAGAYLSRDPVQMGSLRGQDLAKLVIAALIILGIAYATYLSATGSSAENVFATIFSKTWSDL
jgi:hypothetical protein